MATSTKKRLTGPAQPAPRRGTQPAAGSYPIRKGSALAKSPFGKLAEYMKGLPITEMRPWPVEPQ